MCVCTSSIKNRRNWKERKRWWGCIEITLRGVPREQVVRKPTRKYVLSRNRENKKRKRTRKIFSVTAKRWNEREKKKALQLYECSGSEIKLETRGRRSGEKKRVREASLWFRCSLMLICVTTYKWCTLIDESWSKRRADKKNLISLDAPVIMFC